MFKEVSNISFPEFKRINVNMMPFIFGDIQSIPVEMRDYYDIIDRCNFENGSTCYLTITETMVEKSKTQRRGGIHVESPLGLSWGGGWGGITSDAGVYMASTDGRTEVWDTMQPERDNHGRCEPLGDSHIMKPRTMYWMTDLTPHAALPSLFDGRRQFIRVVSSKVDVWYKQHSSVNPLGIQPNAKIIETSKF